MASNTIPTHQENDGGTVHDLEAMGSAHVSSTTTDEIQAGTGDDAATTVNNNAAGTRVGTNGSSSANSDSSGGSSSSSSSEEDQVVATTIPSGKSNITGTASNEAIYAAGSTARTTVSP